MKITSRKSTQTDVTYEQLAQENDELRSENESLKRRLEWFQRQLFGRKSEKRILEENPQQLSFASELFPPAPALEKVDTETVTYERKKRKPFDHTPEDSGLRFDPERVPVEEIRIADPREGQEGFEVVRYEHTYRLGQLAASHVILKYVRPVIKEKATQKLHVLPAPANVLGNSYADVSFVAGMLIDKFSYFQPFYRQHLRLERFGILLSRQSFINIARKGIDLLEPIYDYQLLSCLMSKILGMDETPTMAGRDAAKHKMEQCWFWPLYGDQNEVVFTFSKTRSSSHVFDLLKDFKGTLLTDGYAAYTKYSKSNLQVLLANCWAHARRCFERALTSEPDLAAVALAFIAVMYKHEKHIRDNMLTGAAKLEYRQKHTAPIVDQFFEWCKMEATRNNLTDDPIMKAFRYVINREEALRRFLSDPDLHIDNNHTERALRVMPMGAKNWLFNWTEIGARHTAIIQSLLVTCVLHGVDPYEYLVDVLQRVSIHPASRVEELTPRRWKELFASNPLRSDVSRRR